MTDNDHPVDDVDDDDQFEYVDDSPHCPACGTPIDYCLGHGEIGDPAGARILEMHDGGDHSECHPEGCEDSAHAPESVAAPSDAPSHPENGTEAHRRCIVEGGSPVLAVSFGGVEVAVQFDRCDPLSTLHERWSWRVRDVSVTPPVVLGESDDLRTAATLSAVEPLRSLTSFIETWAESEDSEAAAMFPEVMRAADWDVWVGIVCSTLALGE